MGNLIKHGGGGDVFKGRAGARTSSLGKHGTFVLAETVTVAE